MGVSGMKAMCVKALIKSGVVFFLVASKLYGFDISVTEARLGLGINPEYNRSFYYSWDIAAFGSIELNKSLVLGSGVSMGRTWDIFDINLQASAEYIFPFFRPYIPFHLKFAYLYNGLPDYKTNIHTLLPTGSLQWRWFGGSFGSALRFTAFDKDPPLFENILAYSAYVSFYNTEKTAIWLSLANFSDFAAENLGSYSFYLNNRFSITELVDITSEMEIAMSGNVGRIISVYGLALKEGIVFKW
jgi:hypothetical protein